MPFLVPVLLLAFASVLVIALGVPPMQRKIAQNRLYGYRTQATLRDVKLWYHVNEKTGRDLVFVGLGVLVWLGIASWRHFSPDITLIVGLSLLVGGVVAMALHGGVLIRRWQAEKELLGDDSPRAPFG